MPSETSYFLNIFDVDADRLAYNMEAYQLAIEEFGLLSYEEFSLYLPGLSEDFSTLLTDNIC